MSLFVALITTIGFVFGEIYGGTEYAVMLMFFAFLMSVFSAVGSYYFSDKIVLSISGAKKVERQDAPQLYGMLENLCIGAGLKKIPDLYIIDDPAPNAFATGRDPEHAVVAVTQGLLNRLNKREIEGVLAHELAHVQNYDIRLMTIVVVLVGVVTMMANIFFYGGFGGRDRKSGGGGNAIILLIGILLAVLSPVIAQLIKLAVSRSREYLADASAALLTRDPEGLASALEKIALDPHPLRKANEATAHMYISNPLKKGSNSDWFAGLFNTHPPTNDRIAKLRGM